MARWSDRTAALQSLPALDPLPPGVALPDGLTVEALRTVYCRALAPTDADTDDRCYMLGGITDPLHVLAIVAPHVKVLSCHVEVAPPVVEADEVALPINIGEGGGATFEDHGTTTETRERYTYSKVEADRARRDGGKVTFDP